MGVGEGYIFVIVPKQLVKFLPISHPEVTGVSIQLVHMTDRFCIKVSK